MIFFTSLKRGAEFAVNIPVVTRFTKIYVVLQFSYSV